jgi:hypothetical protein
VALADLSSTSGMMIGAVASVVATYEGEHSAMRNALSTTRRKAAAAVTTAALLAGGGAAAVAANSATASAASPATHVHKAAHKAKDGKGLLARADHATFEVKLHGKWVTLVLDRGAVTSVSSKAVTLHRPDGDTVTEALSATTKFDKGEAWSQIEVGHNATVVSESGVARLVFQGKKAKAHKAKNQGAVTA